MSSPSPAARTDPRRAGLARNAFHLGLGQVTTTALTVLLSAAIARTLGAADFGILYLITQVALFAYVFVDWGHGPYITREVARHPERAGVLLGSVLIVRAITAVTACAASMVVTLALGYDLRTRLLAATLIATWLPMYLGLSFSWVFRGRERMDGDALINVVLKFTTLTISLACLALGGRLLAMILVYAVSGTVCGTLATLLYRRYGLPPITATRDTAIELVRGGLPLLAVALAIAVQPYFDANVLYKLVPREVIGWYGASWNIAGTLVAPATILAAAMYPRLSRAAGDPGQFAHALRLAFRPLLVVAMLGAAGTYLFADVAVGIVYSKQKFGPAGDILRAFAPALLLIYVDMLLGYAIMAIGKAGRLAGTKVAAVCITTGLEIILVPWCQARFGNGGIGIMAGLAGGELFMVAAMFTLIRSFVDTGMVLDMLRGLAGGAATVLVIRLLPPMSAFVGIPVCIAVFGGLSMLVGLVNRGDIELLLGAIWKRDSAAEAPVAR